MQQVGAELPTQRPGDPDPGDPGAEDPGVEPGDVQAVFVQAAADEPRLGDAWPPLAGDLAAAGNEPPGDGALAGG